jgi:hypothetical protein
VCHLGGITTPKLSSFDGELQAGSHFCYWCCIIAALLEEKLEPAAAVNLLDPNYDYAPAVMLPSSTTTDGPRLKLETSFVSRVTAQDHGGQDW